MRAQHSLGLNLSWLRVTTVFLIDIGILWVAGHWPAQLGPAERAWWPAVGLAAVLTTAALITHRRVPLTAIVLARLFDRFATPAAFLTEGCTPGFDHRRRYSRDVVGVREYRGRLVSVIAIPPPRPKRLADIAASRHRYRHRLFPLRSSPPAYGNSTCAWTGSTSCRYERATPPTANTTTTTRRQPRRPAPLVRKTTG